MIDIETVRQIALSLPEVTEQPHVDKPSFRIGKKIFATLNIPANRVCVKLSEGDQYAFCSFDRTVIYPVPNKWGTQGWTLINLLKVHRETLTDALTAAYCEVAPARLSEKLKTDDSEPL